MKHSRILYTLLIASTILLSTGLTSCNEDKESEIYQNPVNLAVTNFSLKYNSKQTGLDSVYFSIDLQHGVIFNADSLPKGTAINKLVPVISYDSRVESAVITMTGGSTREGEVNYIKSPTDSIDFTGIVTLRLTADGGNISTDYRLKVNVHKEEADSMKWESLAQRNLPSRQSSPKAQKTLKWDSKIASLIEESDGSFTLAITGDIAGGDWEKSKINLGFMPRISSLTTADKTLYLLSNDGTLYSSADGKSWASTGKRWISMIGSYGTSVIGISESGGKRIFAQYPGGDLTESGIPDDFPIEGYSNFVTLSNKWTLSPVAFLTGGIKSDGTLSDSTWAFDGKDWIELSRGGIPALIDASIVPYYHYRRSASGDSMNEYKVWLLLGGKKSDGDFNRTVYVSYDNGVNWAVGSAGMQLPAIIPPMTGCDNIVADTPMESDLSNAWKKISGRERLNYTTNGDMIYWDCPYIYLIGGYDAGGVLYNTIWRGVLTRLTFAPII